MSVTSSIESEVAQTHRIGSMLDVGSNAIKLAICNHDERNRCKPTLIDERVTHLNQGLDDEDVLGEAAIHRLLKAAEQLAATAEKKGAPLIGAVGTAALRRAVNSGEVLRRLYKAIGVRTRILTPREEAAAGFIAVRETEYADEDDIGSLATFDLGGRSAELTVGKNRIPDTYVSIELGASYLLSRAGISDPPIPAELEAIRHIAKDQLKSVDRPPRDAKVHLVGATATTLAGYVPMLMPREYGLDAVDHIDREMLIQLVEKLSQLTLSQRKKLPGNPERAGIILHGAIALEQAFKYLGFRHTQVSPDGVATGAMISEFRGTPLDFEEVVVDLPEVDFRPLKRKDRSGEVVFALRRSDGRIYLQRKIDYPAGVYRLPGGGVDIGEEPQSAFWRELREETSAGDVRAIPLRTIRYHDPDKNLLPFYTRLYLVELEDHIPLPVDSDEGIEEYVPVAPEDLPVWADRLQQLAGKMEPWGIFRASAIRALITALEQFPM